MKTNADFHEEDKLASKQIMGNDPGDEMSEEEANEILEFEDSEDDYDDEPDQP